MDVPNSPQAPAASARDPGIPAVAQHEILPIALYSDQDEGALSPFHVIVRREVIKAGRHIASGKVYFQCAFCAHIPPPERRGMSIFAPAGVGSIYRAATRFMTSHVGRCRCIPKEIRQLGGDGAGGRNARSVELFWINTASMKGFRDAEDGRGIVYFGPSDATSPAQD